jgi:hypothetical protein
MIWKTITAAILAAMCGAALMGIFGAPTWAILLMAYLVFTNILWS